MSQVEYLEQHLFRQLADAYDVALAAARDGLNTAEDAEIAFEEPEPFAVLRRAVGDRGGSEAFELAVAQILQMLAHNFLAVLDGASADRPEHRVMASALDGTPLRQGLHERWTQFLFSTGRLT